ncbi:MAG: hypothetical protein EOP48_02805 [Sphingobacteriales bacterium]|nr:MAG: hypothetical protein EOP48_02805 [Sphingobacteriales bacterium]
MIVRNVFIVQFNPIVKYPPLLNFLDYLSANNPSATNITICSTDAHPTAKDFGKNIRLRLFPFNEKAGRFSRLIQYIWFNLRVLILLIVNKPSAVLYFESLSSWAPLIYRKYFNTKTKLLVHYHEYNTPEEFRNGMALISYFHKLEISFYGKMNWISHTNKIRMDMFLNDTGLKHHQNARIVPNYPMSEWYEQAKSIVKENSSVIRLVYVGALSLETTYIAEIVKFVNENTDQFKLDIFSNNIEDSALDFLNGFAGAQITQKGAVDYNKLPEILPKYDIGLIIYKGNTANFEYNAPNKFFEYFTCGLNIIFSRGIKGLYEFESELNSPWVRKADFENLVLEDFRNARSDINKANSVYTAEAVLQPLADTILN